MTELTGNILLPKPKYIPGETTEVRYIVNHPKYDDEDLEEDHDHELNKRFELSFDGSETAIEHSAETIELSSGQSKIIRATLAIPEDYETSQVVDITLSHNNDPLVDAEIIVITEDADYTRIRPSTLPDLGVNLELTLGSVNAIYGNADNADGTEFVIGKAKNETDNSNIDTDVIHLEVDNSEVSINEGSNYPDTIGPGESLDILWSPDINSYTEDKAIPLTLYRTSSPTGDIRDESSEVDGIMRILKNEKYTQLGDALVSITAEPENWSETAIATPDDIGPDAE